MTGDLVHVLEVTTDLDLIAVRDVTGAICSVLDPGETDTLRFVTGVSALTQDLLRAGGGRVSFACGPGRPTTVTLSPVAVTGRQSEPSSWASSAPAVALVVDAVALGANGDPGAVTLSSSRPAEVVTAETMDALAAELAQRPAPTGRDLLHDQTLDLLRVLALPPGAENAVTSDAQTDPDGIVALYHELSEELERTNLGVVALYAELDDKSRQLREASEAKSRFLRNISHELRSPANSIIGLTRLLLDVHADGHLNEEQRDQVNFIGSSARDLLDLVNELLDLAAAESGRVDATTRPVPLRELFEDLRGSTQALLRPGVQLVVHRPAPEAVMRTDRTLLRHILRNLLSNAAKFTASGRVELEAFAEGDRVRIEVRDTGIGVSLEDQGRIFEEFFQVRSPLHAGVKGTGLGLAFAQRIAVTLGGSVEVTSSPGDGSRFAVDLPRDLHPEPVEEGSPA